MLTEAVLHRALDWKMFYDELTAISGHQIIERYSTYKIELKYLLASSHSFLHWSV